MVCVCVCVCRPTEFLPVEYTTIRGVEAKMYKEQEGLSKQSHLQIEETYIGLCSELKTYGAVFFPARVGGARVTRLGF